MFVRGTTTVKVVFRGRFNGTSVVVPFMVGVMFRSLLMRNIRISVSLPMIPNNNVDGDATNDLSDNKDKKNE